MLGDALGQGGSGLGRLGTLIHGLPRHRLLTPMHAHRGVEGLLDGHTFARQAGQRPGRLELQHPALPTHAMIPAHRPLLLHTQRRVQYRFTHRQVRVGRAGGRHHKPSVQLRQELLLQVRVGSVDRVDPSQTQRFDQTVLQRWL